jgi:hypothetical protein
MKQTKLILLLSILILVVFQGCSDKSPKIDSDVIRVESTEVAFDDSIRRPYQEFVYDDNGYLKSSVTRQYQKDSLGIWKENAIIMCDYVRSGKTINIEGVKEDKDVNSGVSQKKDIKVKLECDASGRIIKRTEQPEGYAMPTVDEFEWEGNVIKKKKRYYDGDLSNGSYEDIVEYTYRDGNMVFAELKNLMVIADTRTQINGTMKCEFDTLHLSYQTYPDESTLVLDSNLEMFAVKHSRNQSISFEWASSLHQMNIKTKKQIQHIESVLSGASDIEEYDKNGYPTVGVISMKMKNKFTSYLIESVLNNETEKEIHSRVYYKYMDVRKK